MLRKADRNNPFLLPPCAYLRKDRNTSGRIADIASAQGIWDGTGKRIFLRPGRRPWVSELAEPGEEARAAVEHRQVVPVVVQPKLLPLGLNSQFAGHHH